MNILASLTGTVQRGQARGKGIGFPTLNIQLPQNSELSEGVYVSRTNIENSWYPSMSNIGGSKTFEDEDALRVETHIFGFSEMVYGMKIHVEILEKIRDNKKFESLDDLASQLDKDKKYTEEFFRINKDVL